jgi:RNase P subunit RPR2
MDVDKTLHMFKIRYLQDLLTIEFHLRSCGESLETLEKLYDSIEEKNQELTDYMKRLPSCPKCEGVLFSGEVNTDPGNQVGEGFTFQWACSGCGYERFGREKREDWIYPEPFVLREEDKDNFAAFHVQNIMGAAIAYKMLKRLGKTTDEVREFIRSTVRASQRGKPHRVREEVTKDGRSNRTMGAATA